MKTRSTSRSAFISRSALIALPVLAGVLLGLFSVSSPPVAGSGNSAAQSKQKSSDGPTGTLQKMIVANGSVTMDLDLNRLNGISSAPGRLTALQFTVAANSFFSILVFDDLLRGPEQGSMALVLQNSAPALPLSLGGSVEQLVLEKLPSAAGFDLAVRDAKTGFTFFDIEGGQYDYNAQAKLLSIQGARLLLSRKFANTLAVPGMPE
jgi:hypothetical protein